MSPHPHAIASLIARQTIADEARNTLSSWDSCMSKAYCKWPVVAVIIIGSLIVLSLIFCIARFCCCGMECCCWCCSCFNRCCPSPRSKKTKYVEAPQQPAGYGYQQPMQYGGYGGYNQPQYATYDVSKSGKVQEDSLPAMPSWSEGNTRRVEQPSDEKDFGHEEGIAMGAVGAGNGKKTRDDDPVYREHDQAEPMLAHRATSPSNYTDRNARSPNQHAQQTSGYMSPLPEDQQMNDNYAAGYGYPAARPSSYAPSTAYAPSPVGGSFRSQQPREPAYNYAGYGQQTGYEPQSPSSMYSGAHAPSRAPTYSSRLPPQHSTVAPVDAGAMYNNTSYGHEKDAVRGDYNAQPGSYQSQDASSSYQPSSTAYAPTSPQSPQQQYTPFSPVAELHSESAELPGSLSIGSRHMTGDNPAPYDQYQQQGQTPMNGAPSVRRKPIG